MASDAKNGILLFFCISAVYVSGQTQQVSLVSCLRGSTATEIIATVRAKINGADVTELTSYDEAGNPQTDPACTTNVITNGFLQLTLTFDETSPTCGIVQDLHTTSRFNIIVHAQGADYNQPYHFWCDNADLTEDTISTGQVSVHGQLGLFGLHEHNRDIRLQAVLSGSDLPAVEMELGREIYFRTVLDKGLGNIANTNWGKSFHVGFLKSTPGAKLSLTIYTPAHGSRVTVKGMLTGFEIDQTVTVTRDTPAEISIPSDYQPTSVADTWIVEDKGIEIAVLGDDDPIGVWVSSDNGAGYTDSYVAYPDEVLEGVGANTFYRLPTAPIAGASQAQAVFVATVDFTFISVSSLGGAFPRPAIVNPLHKFQTFHVYCDVSCAGASVLTINPIAIITGHVQTTLAPGTLPGHMISPTIQTENYGQKFVLVNVRSGLTLETHYKVIRGDNAFNTQVTWQHASGPSLLNDGDGPVILVAGSDTYAAEEFEIDPTTYSGNPPYATVTQFLTGTATVEPTMVTLPSIEVWSTELVIPVKGGVDYDLVVISTKDDVGAVTYSTNTVCCQTLTGYAVTDVSPHSGAPVKYGMIAITSYTTMTEDRWLKFETPDNTKPFMVLAYELLASGAVQAYTPFGQRSFEVANCVPTFPQQGSLPVYPGMLVGDGIDNDCDSLIDEERTNGVDDEGYGSGAVDEDLAPGEDATGIKAIYNLGLEMSEDEAFTSPVTLIDGDGCNSDPADDVISTVGHFTASAADNTKYPTYWTIRTNSFGAFRIRNTESVWIRATVGFCDDEAGLCLDSCAGKRKRRDVDSEGIPETIYLKLNILDLENNKTGISNENDNTCWHDAILWSMAILLSLVILIEISLIAIFSAKRLKLTK